MFSTEFATFTQAIFGNNAARAEVDAVLDFYRGLLARLPDQGGYDFWVQQFRTAQCQGAGPVNAAVEAISSSFPTGGEYASRARTNAQYVGDLYNSFLRRGGDLGGVRFWINQLDTFAMTREQVRQNFIASGEFQGRVNAIVAQGCVPWHRGPAPGARMLVPGSNGPISGDLASGRIRASIPRISSHAMPSYRPGAGSLLPAFFVALSSVAFVAESQAAPGDLDVTYGTGGVAQFGPAARGIAGARTMADGSIVMVLNDPQILQVRLARLLPDGTPDPSIGSTIAAPLDQVSSADLEVQPDGRILAVGGARETTNFQSGAIVWRFNTDGTLDESFGTGGWRFIVGGGFWSAKVLADGKVGLAGGSNDFLARLLPDGELDETFGNGGSITHPRASELSSLDELLPLPDGKWLAAGWTQTSARRFLSTTRVLADGSIDTNYGIDGRLLIPAIDTSAVTSKRFSTRAVFPRPDGGVILVTWGTEAFTAGTGHCRDAESSIVLAAVNAQGALDTSFHGSGIRLTRIEGRDTVVHAAARDGAGRILVSGIRRTSATGCSYSSFVARLTPLGTLDPSFGQGGVRDLAPTNLFGTTALVLLGDGSIVAIAQRAGSDAEFAAFKLEGGGPAGDSDADGMSDELEVSIGRDPAVKDNDVFADSRLFVMQQYRDFLTREGDAGGITAWKNNVDSDTQTRGQVIESFFGSTEFQGTIAPVARLYFAYFLRIPDYPGLNFWIGHYRAGNSLESISGFFATSPEFASTYGALDNGQFVTLVYQNVLGRAPDAGGFAFWKGQLDGSQMTRGQVMLGFSESAEYRASSDSMVYVTMMYFGMLRRAPDPPGLDFWVQYRNAGNSGLALIDGFLASQEYRGRFLP